MAPAQFYESMTVHDIIYINKYTILNRVMVSAKFEHLLDTRVCNVLVVCGASHHD